MYHNHSVASALVTSDEDLEATIVSLLDQITEYKREYERLDKKSIQAGDDLAERYPVYNDLYTAAAANFNRVAADLEKLSRADEGTLDRAGSGQDHEKASNDDVEGSTCHDLSGKGDDAPISVNKLYRRIAQLAHPDKTKDTKLHALFLKAKDARKTKSLSELISILATITGEDSIDNSSIISEADLRSEHLARIASLRRELEMVQMQYNQLRSSPMAKMVELLSTGSVIARSKAELMYKTSILDRAKQLETRAAGMMQDIAFKEALRKDSAV
ncbi:MAG: hypothetical protein GY833_22170 [Aestuariibacter sp.]|nr:hypothetical protein [Aestuariibacter sp.]|tara:strand:- start:30787 stop:31605 length:819 start_codon:yes stop_codon:yes gene_type:complete